MIHKKYRLTDTISLGPKQYLLSDSFFGQPCSFGGHLQGNLSQVLGHCPNDSFGGHLQGNLSQVLGYCPNDRFCKALSMT